MRLSLPPAEYAGLTDLVRTAPWATEVKIGGVPIKDLIDRQVRIAFVGTGPLDERTLVPQTRAAADLLASPDGPRVATALRGWLSLAPRNLPTDLAGIAFSTDTRGTALNYLISDLGRPNGLPVKARRAMDPVAIDELQRVATRFYEGVGSDPQLALEEPFVVAGPMVSRGFLETAGKGDAVADPELRPLGRWAGQMLAHELMHRVTPLIGPWVWEPNVQYPGKLQVLEEAATELSTRLPSILERIPQAMGLPDDRSYLGADEAISDALAQILQRAALDVEAPKDEGRVFDLLQRVPTDRLDTRLADAIAQYHGLDRSSRARIKVAITSIATKPGPIDYDQPVDQFPKWQQQFADNLAQQLAAIDRTIADRKGPRALEIVGAGPIRTEDSPSMSVGARARTS